MTKLQMANFRWLCQLSLFALAIATFVSVSNGQQYQYNNVDVPFRPSVQYYYQHHPSVYQQHVGHDDSSSFDEQFNPDVLPEDWRPMLIDGANYVQTPDIEYDSYEPEPEPAQEQEHPKIPATQTHYAPMGAPPAPAAPLRAQTLYFNQQQYNNGDQPNVYTHDTGHGIPPYQPQHGQMAPAPMPVPALPTSVSMPVPFPGAGGSEIHPAHEQYLYGLFPPLTTLRPNPNLTPAPTSTPTPTPAPTSTPTSVPKSMIPGDADAGQAAHLAQLQNHLAGMSPAGMQSFGQHTDLMKLATGQGKIPSIENFLPKNASVLLGRKTDDPNIIIPFVSMPLGLLLGVALQSRSGKWYYGFKGIPYAEPPKRFEPSVPVKPWGSIRPAQKSGSMCPQSVGPSEVVGEEDCLFLDVYQPHPERCLDETPSGKLPVIFNIHGGAYFMGTGSSFGTRYLMDECIVFVSINYRIGAFGFLTTEDGLIPGNLGLKDQVLALQWTRDYISFFRGDPNLVTIMGISAGGSSVSHLIASPMAKGLFHRAIAESGSALNPWSISRNPALFSRTLAGGLNCSVNTTTTALKECLVSKDFKEIIIKQSQATNRSLLIPFAPVIELETAVNPFQTKNPAVRLMSGDFNRVPLITGFTQDEGIGLFTGGILSDPDLTTIAREGFPIAAPTFLNYNQLKLRNEEMGLLTIKIKQFYFGDQRIGQETRENLTNLFSDRFVVQGVFEDAEFHSKFAPVFPYVLTYKGGSTLASKFGYQIPATTHTDDTQYLFNDNDNNNSTDFRPGTEQYEFSKNMVSLWTSFAKTGVPVSPRLQNWMPSRGRSNSQWQQLDLTPKVLFNYLDDRRRFWENLGLYQREFS